MGDLTLQLLTGHYFETSGYRAYRPEGTADWLLIHSVGGLGRFGHAGGELISRSGHWVLIRPGTLHDYGVEASLKQWELVWAHFQPRPEWLPWLSWPVVKGGLMALRIGGPQGEAIASRFRDVHHLLSGDLSRRETFAMNALEEVLLRCDQHNPMASRRQGDQRVRAAMDYFERNLERKTTLDDVASAVGLSTSRLAHLFKAESGQTPQNFLETRRMQRAAELLQRTSFSVKRIAAVVGFESPFYFSQRFKLWTGKSPVGFREASRNL